VIPKSLLEGRIRGRPPTGELRTCIDCGKDIYVKRYIINQGHGHRCKPCNDAHWDPPLRMKGGGYRRRECPHYYFIKGGLEIGECQLCWEVRRFPLSDEDIPI